MELSSSVRNLHSLRGGREGGLFTIEIAEEEPSSTLSRTPGNLLGFCYRISMRRTPDAATHGG